MTKDGPNKTANSAQTRRDLLRVGGAGITLSAFSPVAPSESDSPDRLPVRRSLASLNESDPDDIIPTFREGIEILRDLDEDDPRNWTNLVEIHGFPTGFNLCEHGNWLFLPWHRAYLHYFEEIVREVTGNEAFALPYWNWIDRPALPALFRGDDANPFVAPNRTSPSTADTSITGREQIETVLSDPNFFRAIGGWADIDDETMIQAGSGGFEAPAHDYLHIRVGGDMARGNAPNDPSFWAHHSMLDRLWWEWNARGHPNPEDDAWLDYTFEQHFVNRNGDRVDISVRDIIGLPEQAFTYDSRIAEAETDSKPADHVNTADVELSTVERETLAESIEITPETPPVTSTVDPDRLEPYLNGETAGRLLLTAREVDLPQTESFNARVFVDETAGRSKPSGKSPTAAGTFHFFAAPPGHSTQNTYVDLTQPLREQYRATDLTDPITLTVAGDALQGQPASQAAATIGSLSLAVTQSSIEGT